MILKIIESYIHICFALNTEKTVGCFLNTPRGDERFEVISSLKVWQKSNCISTILGFSDTHLELELL